MGVNGGIGCFLGLPVVFVGMALRGFFDEETDPPAVAEEGVWLECISCDFVSEPFSDVIFRCSECDSLLEVQYETPVSLDACTGSGVWRYEHALPVDGSISIEEGNTPLYSVPAITESLGIADLHIKHEGMNPTGSFKDRGMTVGVRVAEKLGVTRLACASTGNTSASLACYGSRAGMDVFVLLPSGKVAAGKLAQAGLHGARILEVDGNFDDCLRHVSALADRGEAYLLNSVNPFRLEGQKTIGFEILEQSLAKMGSYPDRIVLPVGNAGNTAALYKAFRELVASGSLTIAEVPKLTGVQATDAAPLVEAIENGADTVTPWDSVETRATAIRIGNPVNAPKALPGIRETGGTAVAVSDDEITRAQQDIARAGVGVEPASAASLAGLRKLLADGEVDANEQVVCLTTGHLLKDPDAAAAAGSTPEPVPNDLEAILETLSAS